MSDDKGTTRTPKKARTDTKRGRFIAALRNTANIRAACQTSGVPRRTVYGWKEQDADFAAEWEEALDEAVDTLEAAAWQRGRDGVEKPVYQNGGEVGRIREYSDTLLIFLLKSNRPKKYRETIRNEHTGADGGDVLIRAVDYRNAIEPLKPALLSGPTKKHNDKTEQD